ncbi:1-acyl-sn-glycerol-3-phosphate acyltransferase [bioreactor metagenome]|uniref:1-acyl-sn-glycerol-3-phosphate acyltransferase n=1 Tax=bioreactor metagenome TaxID=1076179 RepID=A0A645AFD5_9ZZZZ
MNSYYDKIRSFLAPIIHFLFRSRAKGTENIPQNGAVIIAPNHFSFIDPFLVAAHMSRRLTFLAKAELFKTPFIGNIMKKIGAIPINRDGKDSAALRAAIKALREENVIVIFPQGKRYRGKKPEKSQLKYGIGFLANITKAPVIPTGIYTRGFRSILFRKSFVSFGKPVFAEISEGIEGIKETNEEVSERILAQIMDEIESAQSSAVLSE